MTPFPEYGRRADAFRRAWPHLDAQFEDALSYTTSSGEPDASSVQRSVRTLADQDLPTRPDLDVASRAARELVVRLHRPVSLAVLDRLARPTVDLAHPGADVARELAAAVGRVYLLRVQTILVEAGRAGQASRLDRAVTALQGRPGALWLSGAASRRWQGREAFMKAHPGVVVRIVDRVWPRRTDALLFPIDSRLLARHTLSSLTLSWDASACAQHGLLHAWCDEQLHIAEQAREMITWWAQFPG